MAMHSTMLPLGTKLPSFSLPDPRSGATLSTAALAKSAPVLVMFLCNHCPYVKHVAEVVVAMANEMVEHGVTVVAINSNSAETHPEDGPEAMKAWAEAARFKFPFVFDESQDVARAFHAACTPEFYLFDREHALAYRGRLDGSTPRNDVPLTGSELRAALEAVLANEAPSADQQPSVGCGIKWHPDR